MVQRRACRQRGDAPHRSRATVLGLRHHHAADGAHLGSLVAAWRSPEPLRDWWVAAAGITLLAWVGTFAYFITGAGGLLLGRKTYEIFAAHWPKQPAEDPVAPIMNALPKFVASSTLREPLDWQGSTLLDGDVAAAVGRLKQQEGKNLLVIGSGRLVQSLMRQRLVDEYRLMRHPLILGSGKRLFQEGALVALRLADSKTTGTGVLILKYQPA